MMYDAVKNITEALKSSNLYENTIIVWFSYNGWLLKGWPPGHETAYGANNWPLRGAKLTQFEGGTKTLQRKRERTHSIKVLRIFGVLSTT